MRSLKLTLLGDVDQLRKSLQTANTDVEQSSSRLGDFSKKAGLAFAAAGAAAALYAGKYLVEATKNAAEDEKAQRNLALTLENTTGATRNQIAAVESYISAQSLAYGVTDDQLRPAFERLTRSTQDTQKSQELLNLAITISAATSKPLETITAALAKAYDGNASSLGRLGLGVDSSILKSKDFNAITTALRQNFAGFAEQEANTFEGKLRRLQIAFDEGKETIGSFVLDGITPLVAILVEYVIPIVQNLSTNIGENLKPTFEALSTYFTDILIPTFQAIYDFIKDFIFPIIAAVLKPAIEGLTAAFKTVTTAINDNKTTFDSIFAVIKTIATFVRDYLAPAFGTILKAAFETIGYLAAGLFVAFSKVVSVIKGVVDAIKSLIDLVRNNPLVQGIGNLISNAFGGGRAAGGSVVGGTSYLVGERGAELFTPSQSGTITPNNRLGGNTIINLNVSGAIDPEGTARTIINTLNNSAFRGTGGASNLVAV